MTGTTFLRLAPTWLASSRFRQTALFGLLAAVVFACQTTPKGLNFSQRYQNIVALTTSHQAVDANKQYTSLESSLNKYSGTDKDEFKLRLAILNAALYGMETQYSVMDKRMKDVEKQLQDGVKYPSSVAATAYLDMAEAYVFYGYAAHAQRYLRLAKTKANYAPRSIPGFRMLLVDLKADLLGQNYLRAKTTLDLALQNIDSLPKPEGDTAMRQQLKAALWPLRIATLNGLNQWEEQAQAVATAELWFKKSYKKKNHHYHDLQLETARGYALRFDLKQAQAAYENALKTLDGPLGYPSKSLPRLITERELATLLMENGLLDRGRKHVASISKIVEGRFKDVPEYEAQRSLGATLEFVAGGLVSEAHRQIKDTQRLTFGTYQYSPVAAMLVNDIHLRLAMSDDSSAEGRKLLASQANQAKLLAGSSSALHAVQLAKGAYLRAVQRGNWAAAADTLTTLYETVLSKQMGPILPQLIDVQNMLARCLEETDKLKGASQLLVRGERSLKSQLKPGSLAMASQLEMLAGAEISLGAYLQAEDHLLAALEIVSQPAYKRSPVYKAAMRKLVRLYILYNDLELAQEFINYALDANTVGYHPSLLYMEESNELRPMLAYIKGQYRLAEEGFMTQLLMADEMGEYGKPRKISPLYWLGLTYLEMGDYPNAEKAAQEAAGIALELYSDTSRHYFESQAVLQKLYRFMGNSERSASLAERILAKARRTYGPGHIQVAQGATELALASYMQNDSLTSVPKLLKEAKEVYQSTFGEQHLLHAEACKNLAGYYLDKGQLNDAEALLSSAAEVYKKKLGKRPVQLVEVLMLQGDLYLHKKEANTAIKSYNQALELVEKNFSKQHPRYMTLMVRKAKALDADGNYKAALKLMKEASSAYLTYFKGYFPYLSEREKSIVWNQSQRDFNYYRVLASEHYQQDADLAGDLYNLSLATKGLLLNNSQGLRAQLLNSKDKKVLNDFTTWLKKRELLASNVAEQASDAMVATQQKLALEVETLEKRLSASSPAFANFSAGGKGSTWQEVKASLQKNELAVELIRASINPDSVLYLALVVGGSYGKPEVVKLTNGAFLENKAIRYYRNAMRYKLTDSLSYNWFWSPLAKAIPAKSRVYFSAEGVFNQLNLLGLRKQQGTYLADELELVQLGSTRELSQAFFAKSSKSKSSTKPNAITKTSAVLVANPTFYNDGTRPSQKLVMGVIMDPLPGTQSEVDSIQQLLNERNWAVKVINKKEATEDTVKSVFSPGVLHLATHGVFVDGDGEKKNNTSGLMAEVQAAENSMLRVGLLMSGGGELLLSDTITNLNLKPGILTAYEVMNMNLSQTDLVVLSACETGLGHLQNGEGVFGLQRAFQVAGAKNVVFSLFKVDDEVTARLMQQFYSNLLGGMGKREAFYKAQASIRKQNPEASYWASFVMLGR